MKKLKTALLSLILLATTLSKAQTVTPTGTIAPVSNTVISSICEFTLCGQINKGPQSTYAYLSSTHDLTGYFADAYYNSITFNPTYTINAVDNFCISFQSMMGSNYYANNLGIYPFYLIASFDGTNYEVIDSVYLNITNPLLGSYNCILTPTIVTSNQNSDVIYSISPLDAQQTYNINIWGINTFTISNATSYNYTFTANNNTNYYGPMGFIYSSCPNSATFMSTITTTPYATNSPTCPVYLDGSLGFLSSLFCTNELIQYNNYMLIGYGLLANETISISANFSDGLGVKTVTTNATATGEYSNSSALNLFNQVYASPGVYSIKVWATSTSVCYIDTAYFSLDVTNNLCAKVKGKLYNDTTGNCLYDIGEKAVHGALVQLTDGINTFYSSSDYNGGYSFSNIGAGTYTIGVVNPYAGGYSILCSNSISQTITLNNTATPTIIDFALGCIGPDLTAVGLNLWGVLFPNDYSAIYPQYNLLNYACGINGINGYKKIVLPPCLQYNTNVLYSSPPNAIVPTTTGDTLIWNMNSINDLFYFFVVPVFTCTNVQIGDTLCITEIINTNSPDPNLSNNIFTRCFVVGVAYDPNYKEVSPQGIGTQGYIPATTEDLTYTIHFQNTGTAPAHNVFLLDTISQHLDVSTIQILESSHAMQPYWLPNNTIKFMFANIMLPDSTLNEPQSHGYVSYKIKPKANLANGTEIKNRGYIYFDYNSPIVTNSTLNTIGMPSNTGFKESTELASITLYPNPVTNFVRINSAAHIFKHIKILDVMGKEVQSINHIDANTYELNTTQLANGTYFIEVTTSNYNKYVKKMVKISAH